MTISVVQVATGDEADPAVFEVPVTVGNTVFAIIGMYSSLPQTVTDILLGDTAVDGTAQLEFPQTAGGGSPQGVLIAMLPDVQVSGQTEVNWTTSGSVVATAMIEVSGLGANPTLDQSVSASGSTGTIITGTTGETTVAAEFALAAAATYNGTTDAPSQTWSVTSLGIEGHLSYGYDIQADAGQTYAWTQTCGGEIGWAGAIVTVYAAASASVSGAAAELALAAPAGAPESSAAVSGAVAELALAAAAGTAAASAAVAGPVAALALAAPAGAPESSAAVSGAVAGLALAAPAGAPSAGGSASVSGAVAELALAAPAGSVPRRRYRSGLLLLTGGL